MANLVKIRTRASGCRTDKPAACTVFPVYTKYD